MSSWSASARSVSRATRVGEPGVAEADDRPERMGEAAQVTQLALRQRGWPGGRRPVFAACFHRLSFCKRNDVRGRMASSPKGKSRRSKSSDRWLREHFADPFVRRARAAGLRSRAVFKLEEIDRRERLLKPGSVCLDLGAAPGAWSQYAPRRVGARGRVVASDILPMQELAGVEFVQGDFREPGCSSGPGAAARRAGRCRAVGHGTQPERCRRRRSAARHVPGGAGPRHGGAAS